MFVLLLVSLVFNMRFALGASAGDIELWTSPLKVHGDPCTLTAQRKFHSFLGKWTDAELETVRDDPQWGLVCNPFKFFQCDSKTEKCVCCNNDDGHLTFDPKTGRCRIKLGGQCGSPNSTYAEPCFQNPLFQPLKNFEPDVVFPSQVQCSNGTYVLKISDFQSQFLDFGNNDLGNDNLPRQKNGLGQGSPCNITQENNFIKALRLRGNSTDFSWFKDFHSVCNIFKYLRCDAHSGKCICWHEDLFWAPVEIKPTVQNDSTKLSMDFGRYKGRCRVALDRSDSCSVDLPVTSVLPKYKKPFGLEIFDLIPEPVGSDYELKTLDSKGLRCIPNSWNRLGHFECVDKGKDICKTDLYFLTAEMKLLRKLGGKDTDWSFPPNDLCEESKQDDILRLGALYTWDFDRVRDIIIRKETRDYCNPFIHQICFRGICGCQRPITKQNLNHGLKGDRYVYRDNECIPEEGITCSRRYWYNGNWVNFLDECDLSLKCVLAPDRLNHVCCDPQELKKNRIPFEARKKGRCRDQLLAYNKLSPTPKPLSKILLLAAPAILATHQLK